MTMDTVGIPWPKTVEGATAHIAAYLINNLPTIGDPMVSGHRVALESLRIIGNKVAPNKEKSPRRTSGSRRRSS
jgi:hypothetical protein